MVLLTFVSKCFQDRNFHGVVVGLYEQSIESWVGLSVYLSIYATYFSDFHIKYSYFKDKLPYHRPHHLKTSYGGHYVY